MDGLERSSTASEAPSALDGMTIGVATPARAKSTNVGL